MLKNEMFPSGNDYNQRRKISARQSEITNYAEYLQEMILAHKSAEIDNWIKFLKEADGPIWLLTVDLHKLYAQVQTDF